MDKYRLCYYGHPYLHQRSKEVTNFDDPDLRLVIQSLKRLTRLHNGVGLAANQIGSELRLFCILCAHSLRATTNRWNSLQPKIFINPILHTQSSVTHQDQEGCLSLPGITDFVQRPQSIVVSYQDEKGQIHTEQTMQGFPARVFLHELDHLNGIFFIDHLSEEKKGALQADLDAIRQRNSL